METKIQKIIPLVLKILQRILLFICLITVIDINANLRMNTHLSTRLSLPFHELSPFPNQTDVLGANSVHSNIIQKSQIKQKLIDMQTYWQTIIKQYPNYRDAYTQLGFLYYQLGDTTASVKVLQQAQFLDPNNTKLGMYIHLLQ
jgi:hypothetical protein